ncbi:TIGR01621 family pseudouridine synthase [Amphritea sp. HPY]|uniref:TIGR01621 family pseudouridine synthase n=1 Tax=Amphritea sp. HPY TaxID=3421652 RepID=UPI003D7F0F73
MFQVIDQTSDFLVIDKSPGISMHKDQQEQGLVMLVQQALGIEQLYPVHRLDKMTSGLLVLAKHAAAASELSKLFQQREVSKFYLAISDKKPGKKQGLVRGDMVKARRGSWKLSKACENPALTQFFSHSLGGGLRLFLLKPHTGKTHQIRVAMKSVGAAIVGDERYHEVTEEVVDRGYLHAYSLSFNLQGRDYCFRCPPRIGELFQLAAAVEQISHWQQPELLAWPVIPGQP